MTPSPLQRIQVNDGMLITADHWRIAHSYHQQRQAIHYESLHQGGIVSGLGVSVGPIPEDAPSKYRQPRWLTVQPGLAIDHQGNPIVVAQPESCYLSAQPTEETTIYVVLKHSERSSQNEIVQEAFQILEKDVPAEANEIELCRVQVSAGEIAISSPEDVFYPVLNQLDLRHRRWVQARPKFTSTLSTWSSRSLVLPRLEALLAALPGLYSHLQGHITDQPLDSDLTYLTHDEFCHLPRTEQHQAAQYLRQGGVMLVEATADQLGQLYQVEAELKGAIATQCKGSTSLYASAEQELTEVQGCLLDAVTELADPLLSFLEQEGLGASQATPLPSNHPLRLQPFSFGRLPTLNGQPIGLYAWGGLLLLVGPLPKAWSLEDNLHLSREEIRSAQEFGINLLNFAVNRRQMHQWLTPES